MTTQALTTQSASLPSVTVNHAALWSREQIDVIKETVAKGATDAQLQMFLALAARYGLDPFAKEIWCVNMGGGMTIMASRDGYLKAAQRDPGFQGLKSFVVREGDHFEIDPANDTVAHKFGAKRGAILGAWAMACHEKRPPVIVWSEFSEYNKGNNVWKQYPSAMIQKVAEVMALKRQFGINGLVTQEEIGTPDERPYTSGPTVDTNTGEVNPPVEVMASTKQLSMIALEQGRVYGQGFDKDPERLELAKAMLFELFRGKWESIEAVSRKDLTKGEASDYIEKLSTMVTFTA